MLWEASVGALCGIGWEVCSSGEAQVRPRMRNAQGASSVSGAMTKAQ